VELTLELKSENYESFVTELSVQELKGQNYRDIKASIENIDKIIKSSIGKYLEFTHNINVENAKRLSDSRIDTFIKNIFDKNIIPLNISKHKIEKILIRANEKIPPFNIESNSDKGFKDTLLWLSILDFYKDKKDVEVYLVTNDSVFKRYELAIQNEFFELTKLKIQIVNSAMIPKPKKEISEGLIVEKIRKHSVDINEVNLAIEKFLYSVVYDSYGNESIAWNFSIFQIMDNNDVKSFLEYLRKMLYTKYTLFKVIKIDNIFKAIEIKSKSNIEIDRDICVQLIDIYDKMQIDYDILLESFIELLKEKINNMYEFDPESLPF